MKRSLKHRKEILDGLPLVSYSAVQSYALDSRKHFFNFFHNCETSMNRALNWVRVSVGDRAAHAVQLVKHALKDRARDVRITVVENDADTKNVLGSCSVAGDEIKIYTKALHDHDALINTVRHETTHLEQVTCAGTTLSKNTVEECCENYINPGEDYNYYRNKNPMETESFLAGKLVSKDFTKELGENLFRKTQKTMDIFVQKSTENYYGKIG